MTEMPHVMIFDDQLADRSAYQAALSDAQGPAASSSRRLEVVATPATTIARANSLLDQALHVGALPDAIIFDHQLAPEVEGAPFTIMRGLLKDPRWTELSQGSRPKLIYVSSTFDPLLAHVWVTVYRGDHAADKRTWRRVADAIDSALQGRTWSLLDHALRTDPGLRQPQIDEDARALLPFLHAGLPYGEIANRVHLSLTAVEKRGRRLFDAFAEVGALDGKHNWARGREIAREAVRHGIGFVPLEHAGVQ